MRRTNLLVLTSIILLTSGPLPLLAEDQDDSPIRCIRLNQIKSTTILDRQHIVFKLRGDKHYVNVLPYPCIGLRKNKTFMYRTSLNELCDLDLITVLDDFGGGLRPGASCELGTFMPILDVEIGELERKLKTEKTK